MQSITDQLTAKGNTALGIMVDYSYKYPKNFFGQPKINVRHSLLVRDFSVYMQKLEGGNLEVVEVAGLFHDLGKISTVEGHEDLIVKLLQRHKEELNFSSDDFQLLFNACSVGKEVEDILEYKILHSTDNLAFLYDFQYQEAFYRFVGTKTLLFEKRIDPKFQALSLESAKRLGISFYENLKSYWNKRPEEAQERYRPEIEGKDLASYTEIL